MTMSTAPQIFLWPVWRPLPPESIDGKPLATTVSDLVLEFPYERLSDNGNMTAVMRPEFVLGAILFYWISIPLLKIIVKATHFDHKSGAFCNFVALHNLVLAVFSGICAYNLLSIAIQYLLQHGFMTSYCSKYQHDSSLWGAGGLGAWSILFYLSKYLEFVDTWILVLKGKEASFLQVYHHTGIVVIMWGGVVSQSAWLLIAVILNSVIHTLMYTYFVIKTISPKTEIKAARYLTMAQIAQFLLGIACSQGVLFMGESCDSESSRFILACLNGYGFFLIVLFVSFANKKYKKS